jgi:DNA-binding response OmpR family regulator
MAELRREPRWILLADRDHWVAEIYARSLECYGFVVHRVESGSAALACLATTTFDAVLADAEMPDASATELLSAARARDAGLPVLLMTTSPGTCCAPGAEAHLSCVAKPVDLTALAARMREAIGNHELGRRK